MQAQEEASSPPATNLFDDLHERLRKLLAQARNEFCATGLLYSEKLHQFFVELGHELDSADQGEPSKQEGELL